MGLFSGDWLVSLSSQPDVYISECFSGCLNGYLTAGARHLLPEEPCFSVLLVLSLISAQMHTISLFPGSPKII